MGAVVVRVVAQGMAGVFLTQVNKGDREEYTQSFT